MRHLSLQGGKERVTGLSLVPNTSNGFGPKGWPDRILEFEAMLSPSYVLYLHRAP